MKICVGCMMKLPKLDSQGTFNGVLMMDEMSIQEDLQVVKHGKYWDLVGAVDLGLLVNDLEAITKHKRAIQLASHYFQYVFVGFNGFRWPAAYYGTNNVNGHSIYLTIWPLIDALASYGFDVHGVLMDCMSNNQQFCWLMLKPENLRCLRYLVANLYDFNSHLNLVQDCKLYMKKICNSLPFK